MKIAILTAMHARHELNKIFVMGMNRIKNVYDIQTFAAVTTGDAENISLCTSNNIPTIVTKNNPISNKLNAGLHLMAGYDWTHVMILGSDDLISNKFIEVHHRYPNTDFTGVTDMWFWGMNPKRAGYDMFVYWKAGSSRIGAGRVISRRIIEALDYQLWPNGHNSGMDAKSARRVRSLEMDLETHSVYNVKSGSFIMDVKYELNISSLSPIIRRGIPKAEATIWEHLPPEECEALFRLKHKVAEDNPPKRR